MGRKKLIYMQYKLIYILLLASAICGCAMQQLEMKHEIKATVNDVTQAKDGSVALSLFVTEYKKLMGMVVKHYKNNPPLFTVFITSEKIRVPMKGDTIEATITAKSHRVLNLTIMNLL